MTTNRRWTKIRSEIANIKRDNPNADTTELRAELKAARLTERIEQDLASWPALTAPARPARFAVPARSRRHLLVPEMTAVACHVLEHPRDPSLVGGVRDCRCARVRHVHGTELAYIADRCHCAGCRGAHAERARWRTRMRAYGVDISGLVPAAGSARRLEALALLGWSFSVLAGRLGVDPQNLHRVRLQPRILASKAAAIAVLFDELWATPAPAGSKGERISSSRTMRMAVRRGYVPALGWDDDEIDDPVAVPVAVPVSQAFDLVGCGSAAAYRRHCRRGEPLDEACRAAERRRRVERFAVSA